MLPEYLPETPISQLSQLAKPMERLPDPIMLFKPGCRPTPVYRVDMAGWLAQGWSETETTVCPMPEPSSKKVEAEDGQKEETTEELPQAEPEHHSRKRSSTKIPKLTDDNG